MDTFTISERSRADSSMVPALAYCQETPLRNELEECAAGLLDETTETAAADIEKSFGVASISGRIQRHVFVAKA